MKNLGIVVALLVGLSLGYFAGREHLKYEIRSTFSSAAEEFSSGLSEAFGSEFTSGARVSGNKPENENDDATEKAEQAEKLANLSILCAGYHPQYVAGERLSAGSPNTAQTRASRRRMIRVAAF